MSSGSLCSGHWSLGLRAVPEGIVSLSHRLLVHSAHRCRCFQSSAKQRLGLVHALLSRSLFACFRSCDLSHLPGRSLEWLEPGRRELLSSVCAWTLPRRVVNEPDVLSSVRCWSSRVHQWSGRLRALCCWQVSERDGAERLRRLSAGRVRLQRWLFGLPALQGEHVRRQARDAFLQTLCARLLPGKR